MYTMSCICYMPLLRPWSERKAIRRRPLSRDEVNHYIKVAKAIRLTIELHGEVDRVYATFDKLMADFSALELYFFERDD